MKNFAKHLKTYIFRGFLATIPLALSFFVLQFLYFFIDKKVNNWIEYYTHVRIPGLGLILFIIGFYFIGFFASNVIGKRLFSLAEMIVTRIPLIKTIYIVGKQLSATLSLPEQQVFKKVVLVEYFRQGVLTIGFVTGSLWDKDHKEKRLKVFIPTVPNPTSGFIIIVKESQVIDPHWTVEEGIRTVISVGIIGPEEIP